MLKIVYLTVFLTSLSGCIFPDVYKLDVQQGNIVTQDMLNKLKTGMDQRQVLYIMGTPVLHNPYKEKRWDYLYTLEEDDKITKHYKVSVYFDAAFKYSHYVGLLPANPLADDKDELSQEKQKEVEKATEEIQKVEKEVEETQQTQASKKVEDKDFN